MSSKIDVNAVAEILKKNQLDPKLLRQIVEEMNFVTQKDEEEKEPKVKKQWVIMVSDPNEVLKDVDLAGWVMQIPEDVSPLVTEERIHKTAYHYNTTPKGRANPAQTVGEALEFIKRGMFKEMDIWVKTKECVQVLRTSNEIPGVDGLIKQKIGGRH